MTLDRDRGLRRPALERWLWGGATAPGWGLLRTALWPAEALYRLGAWARNEAYDRGWRRSHPTPIPTLAIGNLTVGGAGKTPFSAWVVGELRSLSCNPAVVLRGYGGDEPKVHRLLNAGVRVVVDADRVRGVRAAADDGADVAVLDDAFQHRRLSPTLAVLLVAAESFDPRPALLPRGPWREPLTAARRADLIVVTRKTARPDRAARVEARLAAVAPSVPRGRIAFVATDVRKVDPDALGESVLDELRSGSRRRPIALAGVAHPEGVWAELDRLGIECSRRIALGDHHRYTFAQARTLADAAGPQGILATLKDAVKLRPLIPEHVPLLALTQRVSWEDGKREWDRARERLLAAVARVARPATG